MSPLRSATRIGFPRGRMPGARRMRLTTGALAAPGRLARLHPVRQWWRLVLPLIGLLALVGLGLLAVLLADRPQVETPSVAAPAVSTPEPSVKPPTFDAPSVKPPRLDTPSLQAPQPSLPSFGSGDDQPSVPSAPTGPERRTELTHDHHYRLVWELSLSLLLLALVGLAVLYPLARLPHRGQRVFGATVAAGLLALAVAAFAAGINPQPGPGTYTREPPEIEHSDNLVVKHIHVAHHHEPIYLAVPWLLLGLGSAALAVPGARVVVSSTRTSKAVEGAVA